MRRLTALLIAVALTTFTGCGNDSNLDEASRPGIAPPSVQEEDDRGYVAYPDPPMHDAPDFIVEGKAGGDLERAPVKRCKVTDFDYEVKPKKVKKQIIRWVKQEIEFDRTEDVDPRMMEAEHLHLTAAVLEVESGSSLAFVDWLLIYIVTPDGDKADMAWGADFSRHREPLKVDGSRDLRGDLTETGEVRLLGLTYAQSPTEDTMLGATLTFRSFHDCVWE
jgi:hypothetical protein